MKKPLDMIFKNIIIGTAVKPKKIIQEKTYDFTSGTWEDVALDKSDKKGKRNCKWRNNIQEVKTS